MQRWHKILFICQNRRKKLKLLKPHEHWEVSAGVEVPRVQGKRADPLLTSGPTCSSPGSPRLVWTAPMSRFRDWTSPWMIFNQEVTPTSPSYAGQISGSRGPVPRESYEVAGGTGPGPAVVTCSFVWRPWLFSSQHACSCPQTHCLHPGLIPAAHRGARASPPRTSRAGSTPVLPASHAAFNCQELRKTQPCVPGNWVKRVMV